MTNKSNKKAKFLLLNPHNNNRRRARDTTIPPQRRKGVVVNPPPMPDPRHPHREQPRKGNLPTSTTPGCFFNLGCLLLLIVVVPSTLLFSFQFHFLTSLDYDEEATIITTTYHRPQKQIKRGGGGNQIRSSGGSRGDSNGHIMQYENQRNRLIQVLDELEPKSNLKLPYEFPAFAASSSTPSSKDAATSSTTTSFSPPHQPHQISLCTHLSVGKLERFWLLVQKWNGPISASIYITDPEDITELIDFYYTKNKVQQQQQNDDVWRYTNIHLLLEKLPTDNDEGVQHWGYPHNILRNLSVEYTQEEYAFSLDVDFITQPNASQRLSQILMENPTMGKDLKEKNMILVIPAFEQIPKSLVSTVADDINSNNIQTGLQLTKQELSKQIAEQKIDTFHGSDYPPCQRSTNYERWFGDDAKATAKQKDSSPIPYYFIDYELHYEPYTIVYKNNPLLPRYYEGFRGWGYNKSSWYMEIAFEGFKFAVLRDMFIIHLAHPSFKPTENTDDKVEVTAASTTEKSNQQMIDSMFEDFRHHLQTKLQWMKNDNDVYQMVFQKNKNFVGYNRLKKKSSSKDSDTPILVGWKEYRGNVFGRLYSKDWVHPPFMVTSLLSDNDSSSSSSSVSPNEVITTLSGRNLYLSDEKLQLRGNVKPLS